MAYKITDKCISCGACAAADPNACISCGTCAGTCPVGAPISEDEN